MTTTNPATTAGAGRAPRLTGATVSTALFAWPVAYYLYRMTQFYGENGWQEYRIAVCSGVAAFFAALLPVGVAVAVVRSRWWPLMVLMATAGTAFSLAFWPLLHE